MPILVGIVFLSCKSDLLTYYTVGKFEGTPYSKWADITRAALGSIAVYITRGTLHKQPARGEKRSSTDPPYDKV